MKRRFAAVMAATFCCTVAVQGHSAPAPAPVPADTLTLEEALAAAASRSPLTEAAGAGLRAAEAGREVAALRPNPELSVETENILGTGLYRRLGANETSVSFALPLELGGKRSARIAVADVETRWAAIKVAVTDADLRLAVTEAYVVAIAAERRADIAQMQEFVAAETLRVARNRVMAGANSPIDEQRAMLEQVKSETDADIARQDVSAARAALGHYIGDPALLPLDGGWFDDIGAAISGPLETGAAEGTLAHASAEADLADAEAGLRLARSLRVPDLRLTAGTRRLEASNDQAMLFGVSIPLPLFNNGGAAVDQAARGRDQADARRRAALFEAERAIAAARADRDRAVTAARASGPTLAAANEAARIARIGYAEGKFDQMVLLDAERTLLEIRRAVVDGRSEYRNALARLERLTTRYAGPGDIR